MQTFTKMDAGCTNAACRPTVLRSIWDGDQLLVEIRNPAESAANWDREVGLDTNQSKIDYGHFGRVLYAHGLSIDQPVQLIRLDYGPGSFFNVPIRLTPTWNWRGIAVTGTFQDRLRYHCHGGTWVVEADTACVDVGWSGDMSAFMRSGQVWNNTSVAPAWEGSLISSSTENSDQLYMRDRYYDPVQGRFTQEDPIGLGGGLNLYGFAQSDPINFSDPFGTEVCFPRTVSRPALKKALEDATDTKLEVDDATGCVTKVTRGKKKGFSDLQARLERAVGDSRIFNVIPGHSARGSESNSLGITIIDLLQIDSKNGVHYPMQFLSLCVVNGLNGLTNNRETPASIMAHELLGHQVNGLTGDEAADEDGADNVENEYHRAANETLRIAYVCPNPTP